MEVNNRWYENLEALFDISNALFQIFEEDSKVI